MIYPLTAAEFAPLLSEVRECFVGLVSTIGISVRIKDDLWLEAYDFYPISQDQREVKIGSEWFDFMPEHAQIVPISFVAGNPVEI